MDISLAAMMSIVALAIVVIISCVNEDLNVGFLGIAFAILVGGLIDDDRRVYPSPRDELFGEPHLDDFAGHEATAGHHDLALGQVVHVIRRHLRAVTLRGR